MDEQALLNDLDKRLALIESTINGNGHQGLVRDVKALKMTMNKLIFVISIAIALTAGKTALHFINMIFGGF